MQASRHPWHFVYWTMLVLVVGLMAYVASSGPVLAVSFWLREAPRWDGWYATMLFYYPLIALGHGNPIDAYVDFCLRAIGTVGPG
mgnify:CR=1 FL=1